MANRSLSSEDRKLPSSEDILRSLEPHIDRVERSLRTALSGAQSDTQRVLALRSVGLLRSFLHKIIDRVADQDLAERAAVYFLVAERCAGFLGQPANQVYPAVLSLCGEADANMTDGVPVPVPEVLSALENVLLQVTVTYSVKGERAERTVIVLLHDVPEQQVREQKIMEEIPWEKIPEDVREKFIRDGKHPVTFTLYQRGQ
jgi:hypothetical protein